MNDKHILQSIAANEQPSSSQKDRQLLMTRLQQFLEKRFNQPEDDELHKLYLNAVHYVYDNVHVRTVDLSARLEPSFQVLH
jgi:hypothetical protein